MLFVDTTVLSVGKLKIYFVLGLPESSFIKAFKDDFCIAALLQSQTPRSLLSELSFVLPALSNCTFFLTERNK